MHRSQVNLALTLTSIIFIVSCATAPQGTGPSDREQSSFLASQGGQPRQTRAGTTIETAETKLQEHSFIKDAEKIKVTPRLFGVSGCRLKIVAVYKTEASIVVAYEPAPCSYLKTSPQISLTTPKGNLRLSEISLPVEKEKLWPYSEMVVPIRNKEFYMKFATDIPHTAAEAAASGIARNLCISYDCLNDYEGQKLAAAYAGNMAVNRAIENTPKNNSGIQHNLLQIPPFTQNTQRIFEGNISPINMYFYGIQTIAKSRPATRLNFINYLSSTQDYESINVANNPFDKQDYATSLQIERAAFVDRLLSQQIRPAPKSVVFFGYAALDNYDMSSQMMSFRGCRDYGRLKSGMDCSHGGFEIGSTRTIGEQVLQIANEGALVSRGRAKPMISGQYHKNGPYYSIGDFGIPHNYNAHIPKEIARAIFDMAKASPIPEHVKNQGYSNKMIGFKLMVEDFVPTSLKNGTVYYSATPKAFCFFNYNGEKVVYCSDFANNVKTEK